MRATKEEISTIVDWVKQGSKRGNPADAPKPVEWQEGWWMGEPDLVVSFPEPFFVEDSVQDLYHNVTIKLTEEQLPEDKWITMTEFRPGSEVVHHIIAYVTNSEVKDQSAVDEDADLEGDEEFLRTRTMVGGLAPGTDPGYYPEGFGIPVVSGVRLTYLNQALNMRDDGSNRAVRYKNELYYLDDPRCDLNMTPLHLIYGQVQVAVGDTELYEGTLYPSSTQKHASCSPGEAATKEVFSDRVGQSFAYHWVLKPGREVRRTLATHQMQIDRDTTLHYIIAHMHPYGKSLALRDLTEDKELFRSELDTAHEGEVITKLTDFSSTEGIPLYRDHDYEVVSVYDNTSGVDQDAMAILYMYAADRRYQKPQSVPACRSVASSGSMNR